MKAYSKIKEGGEALFKRIFKSGREKELKNNVLLRYLVKELLLYFSVAFLFFFVVFFVNQILLLAESVLKKRVPFPDAAKLIVLSFPAIIAQSGPFATLVGFLMCLGRIMSDNEVLIIRASGLNYSFFIAPVLILGTLISLVSFFVNDYLLPASLLEYNKLFRNIIVSNPVVDLQPNSIKKFGKSAIIIGDINDNVIGDIIFVDESAKENSRIIFAKNTMGANAKKEGVLMQLKMGKNFAVFFDRIEKKNYDYLASEKALFNIFDSAFMDDDRRAPHEMTCVDLWKEIKEMRENKETEKSTLNFYSLEFNKKFSLPSGSFFFALLALPLAFVFGKMNGQTIGLILGLFICMLYWAAVIVGQLLSVQNGMSGFWTMWLPNLAVGVLGVAFYFVLKRK